jgi:hypothetical protein
MSKDTGMEVCIMLRKHLEMHILILGINLAETKT